MEKKQKNKKKAKKQEIQKAGFGGMAGGMAIAGASAMIYDKATGQEFAQFETADGHIVAVWTDTDNDGVYDTEFVRATPIPENEEEQITEVVHADPAPINDDGLTFSEAFRAARNELGAGGVFEWNGQMYNTFYAEEWQNMTEEQHSEWAALPDDEKIEYYNSIDDTDDSDIDNQIAEEEYQHGSEHEIDNSEHEIDDDQHNDELHYDDDNEIAEEEMEDDIDNDADISDWEIV